ncbi:hypothetical protein N9584_02700 [Flavobacteriaceae bacterium]|nr:hypothetical protein [Flavobacteriaceae bacterium]
MKNHILKFTFLSFFLILISCGGGGEDCGDIDTTATTPESSDFKDVIEQFNSSYSNLNSTNEFVYNTNVYVDLSDGITKYALANSNNKKLLQQFFFTVQNEENLTYNELSDDKIIPYQGTQALSYFIKNGHYNVDGSLKRGAPIDKAFNEIASKNELGIVITDGELYDPVAKEVSMNPWASDALKSWFAAGGKLNMIYTDFSESNGGKNYNKHMYIILFIPKLYEGNLVEGLAADFADNGITYKNMTFDTDVSDLYTRDYPDAQTPGTLTFNEEFSNASGYFSENNFEYINLADDSDFNTDDNGLVYYLRDLGDEDGKKRNRPLLEKLFVDLESINNYKVENINLNVTNVSDDFVRFKRNYYAKKNLPEVLIAESGKDSLSDDNFLVFNECYTLIDGIAPYDVFDKVKSDTDKNFVKMLNPDFTFKQSDLNSKQVKDFLFLDQEAGDNNQKNLQNYEVVLKFDEKFNEDNSGFLSTDNNIIKVDIVVESKDFDLKNNTVNRNALTWDKIDDSGEDQTLYTSLLNVLKNNKPNSILYTYYIELGPFNQ